MSKYFKIDRNSREIIIDKHKSYNVNIDILDLIIDLQLEKNEYKDRINKTIEYINYCLEENCEDSGDYLDNTHIGEKLISILRGEEL